MERPPKRIYTLSLLLLFQTLSVNSMQVSAKIATPVTEYRDITLENLLSIYEHAYSTQHFHIHANGEKTMPEGNRLVRLTVDMANQARVMRKAAQISFLFYSPDHNACIPCSVTRETFSVGDYNEYTGEEWATFQHQLIAADKRALDEIRQILGKSVPPLDEPAGPPAS